MKSVLIVEDEPTLGANLCRFLEAEGFRVILAATARAARECVREPFDLIILDWMLPDGRGPDLLLEWRRQGMDQPIILLTARVDLTDRVVGLELGADDYVTKPFEPRELVARIHARLRRHSGAAPPPNMVFGELDVDPIRRHVSFRGGPVALTKMEFDLLLVLVQNAGRVFSREELLHAAYGGQAMPTARAVDNHILQLRQKLDPEMFESVRGVGFRFVAPEGAHE